MNFFKYKCIGPLVEFLIYKDLIEINGMIDRRFKIFKFYCEELGKKSEKNPHVFSESFESDIETIKDITFEDFSVIEKKYTSKDLELIIIGLLKKEGVGKERIIYIEGIIEALKHVYNNELIR